MVLVREYRVINFEGQLASTENQLAVFNIGCPAYGSFAAFPMANDLHLVEILALRELDQIRFCNSPIRYQRR